MSAQEQLRLFDEIWGKRFRQYRMSAFGEIDLAARHLTLSKQVVAEAESRPSKIALQDLGQIILGYQIPIAQVAELCGLHLTDE